MIRKLMAFLCIIGLHDWVRYRKGNKRTRHCPKCRKYQEGSYDMLYGETIWETSHNTGKQSIKPDFNKEESN